MVKKASELDLNDAPARESRLFLVDGNSLAYRAFYALPEDFSTSEGFPTGALFGFASMMMKLLQDYTPSGVVVCWDEKPTVRLELHEGYKGSRKPTPELLKEQRPFFPELTDFDPGAVLDAPPDRSKLAELFRKWEMHQLLRRLEDLEVSLPSLAAATAVPAGPGITGTRLSGAELRERLATCVDAGVAVAEGVLAVATADGTWLVDPDDAGVVEALAEPGLIGHDVKAVLRATGAERLAPAFDTALAAYLLDPGRNGYVLDDLLREHALAVATEGEGAEALREAIGARLLCEPLTQRLAERRLLPLLADLELPLVPVLAELERVGIAVDIPVLEAIAARCASEVAELETEAHRLAGGAFTLGSPKQLGDILFNRLDLPVQGSGKTGPSTDRTVLAKLRPLHPIIPVIERWRELSKLLSTYLRALPEAAAHDGLAAHGRHRAAVVHESQSPGNPRAHTARPGDPRGLRCAAGLPADLLRLLAGRAAHPRPPLSGTRARRRVPPR